MPFYYEKGENVVRKKFVKCERTKDPGRGLLDSVPEISMSEI